MGNCCTSKEGEIEAQMEISKVSKQITQNIEIEGVKSSFHDNMKSKKRRDDALRLVTTPHPQTTERKDYNTLREALNIANILEIKILTTNYDALKDQTFKINPFGLVGSERSEKDGYCYFGYVDIDKNPNALIDFNFPMKSNENSIIEDKCIGQHFKIEFKTDNYKYCLKDLGVGFGTFSKMDFPLILKDNHLINIGESFIVVNILDGNQPIELEVNQEIDYNKYQNLQLRLKVFGVNNNGETYFFPHSMKKINIGRNKVCNLQILDKLLSKIHCSICFNKGEGWTLYDGDNDNPSTNGTWLYLNEDFEIYENLMFKSNHTIFQCFLKAADDN